MIKADGPAKVKPAAVLSLALAALCLLAPRTLSADVSEKEVQNLEQQEFGIESGKTQKKTPEPPAVGEKPPEDYQQSAEPEKVRGIEAEEFRVRFIKKSRSGKVLMFDDLLDNRPRPGKVLLIKKDNDDIIAVRVLKNFPKRFAAKVVLPINEVKPEIEYRAIKKLGDKITALIKEREKRGKDLDAAKTDEDLAKEVSPDDNELDRGIPQPKAKKKVVSKVSQPEGETGPASPNPNMPPPLFNKEGQEIDNPDSIEVKDEDEPYADISVQEELPIEARKHAFSLEYASLKSVDKDSNAASYNGIGLRYAFNAWRMPFWHRRNIQDMLTFELGLFYYTISGFATATDSVTVYPLVGTMRYNLMFGDTFTLFG
ncbi:MAG: hypothetical protein HY075_02210, partial [Deltaproteobacteria bacterium]|nr:hypothetical protein [Deltaproteobacteria bacterium]